MYLDWYIDHLTWVYVLNLFYDRPRQVGLINHSIPQTTLFVFENDLIDDGIIKYGFCAVWPEASVAESVAVCVWWFRRLVRQNFVDDCTCVFLLSYGMKEARLACVCVCFCVFEFITDFTRL